MQHLLGRSKCTENIRKLFLNVSKYVFSNDYFLKLQNIYLVISEKELQIYDLILNRHQKKPENVKISMCSMWNDVPVQKVVCCSVSKCSYDKLSGQFA